MGQMDIQAGLCFAGVIVRRSLLSGTGRGLSFIPLSAWVKGKVLLPAFFSIPTALNWMLFTTIGLNSTFAVINSLIQCISVECRKDRRKKTQLLV